MITVKSGKARKQIGIHIYDRHFPVSLPLYGQNFGIYNILKHSKTERKVVCLINKKGRDKKLERINRAIVGKEKHYVIQRDQPHRVIELLRTLKKREYEIHVFFHTASFPTLSLGIKKKLGKCVTTYLCLHCMPKIYGINEENAKFTEKAYDKFIAVSQSTFDTYSLLLPKERMYLIPNGINLSIYNPEEKKRAKTKKELISLGFLPGYMGRIDDSKGLKILLFLVKEFEGHKQKFLIVTSSIDEVILFTEKYRRKFGNEPKYLECGIDLVKVSGKNENKMIKYLARKNPTILWFLRHPAQAVMDVLFHTSLSEAFNRTIHEALALGTPVVAMKISANEEVVRECGGALIPFTPEKNGRGYLSISYEQAEHIAKKMIDAIDELKSFDGEKAFEKIKTMCRSNTEQARGFDEITKNNKDLF